MKKINIVAVVIVMASAAMAGLPVSTSFTLSKSGNTIDIDYSLDSPAIVTFDVLTNGVSIHGSHLLSAVGDLNVLVTNSSCKIIWTLDEFSQRLKFSGSRKNADAVLTVWPANLPPDYMVLDLDGSKRRWFYPNAEQVPGGVTSVVYKTEKLVMRRIRAAGIRWRKGSPVSEKGRDFNQWNPPREVPHFVTLTNDFYIGIYEFTQKQLELACGTRYGGLVGDAHPAENISYATLRGCFNEWHGVWPNLGHEVPSYCPIYKLRDLVGLSDFDIPTEAQWEFACRAGSGTSIYGFRDTAATSDDVSVNLDKVAWYNKNSDGAHHEVGLKAPNAFGLYDMLGNVAELCLDCYQDGSEVEKVEPIGPVSTYNSSRVLRGGSYSDSWMAMRCAYRPGAVYNSAAQSNGFRVSCSIPLADVH
ncbi:MAG: formylglycine-generating enzyme family protein [Kiritimatiellae bacterium]|nr:formylglycine-generating enzyme family protein [Kiritimatiellia bacterium]